MLIRWSWGVNLNPVWEEQIKRDFRDLLLTLKIFRIPIRKFELFQVSTLIFLILLKHDPCPTNIFRHCRVGVVMKNVSIHSRTWFQLINTIILSVRNIFYTAPTQRATCWSQLLNLIKRISQNILGLALKKIQCLKLWLMSKLLLNGTLFWITRKFLDDKWFNTCLSGLILFIRRSVYNVS